MSIIIKNSSGGGITLDSSTTANETLALPAGGGAILSDTSTLASSKLSGALPAIDGGSLTGISGISLGTEVATTSGTSIDFTGIPAGVKRITLMFNRVSTSGSSNGLVQIGTSSGIETSSYSGSSWQSSNHSGYTTGFGIRAFDYSTVILSGQMTIQKVEDNIYISSSVLGRPDVTAGGGGAKTLGGVLDRLRLTTVNGTDTFDAGSINISWES